MKKFVNWIVAFVTIIALTQAASAWVIDSTLLSSKFILKQVKASGFYSQLAQDLPHFLRQSEDEGTRQGADVIIAVVTPRYLEGKISSYVTQLEARYKDDGPTPSIDLSDLNSLAAKQGFNLPAQAAPIKTGDPVAPSKVKPFIANIRLIKYLAPIIGLLMLGVTAWIAEPGRRLYRVAKMLGWSAFWMLPNWLFFMALPDLIGSFLANNAQLAAIAPAIKTLIKAVCTGVAKAYLYPAAGFAAAMVLAILLHWVAKLIFRPKKPSKRRKSKDEGGMVTSS